MTFHRGFFLPLGKTIPEHKAPKEIAVQCVSGEIGFIERGEAHRMTTGKLLHLKPGELHSLTAIETSVILVTMAKEALWFLVVKEMSIYQILVTSLAMLGCLGCGPPSVESPVGKMADRQLGFGVTEGSVCVNMLPSDPVRPPGDATG